MPGKLVIIEAPGKLKKFQQALGKDYEVQATWGHIIDLPAKKLSVDIRKDFAPTFEIYPDKKQVVRSLKQAAKRASEIYLMTDEDREGEAIAWHVYNEIKGSTKAKIRRATTSSVTKQGILNAIEHARDLDEGRIEAYLSRRILDRLAGYKTSFLTQQATGGKSAGRVQSALLRLIVEREEEIRRFVPEEYWVLTAELETSKGECFNAVLSEKVKVPDEKTAKRIDGKVRKSKPTISKVQAKEVNVRPYPPFTTIPMTGAASSILNISSERTMKIAQGLYEAGLCLLPDELVVLPSGKIITIEEAVNREEEAIIGFGGIDTLDLSTQDVDVFAHQKIPYDGGAVGISTYDGQEITVTPDHNFLVYQNQQIEWMPAEDLLPGTFVLCSKNIKVHRNFVYHHMYYLIRFGIRDCHAKIRVNLKDNTYTKDILSGMNRDSTYYKYLRNNRVPFCMLVEYLENRFLGDEEEKFVGSNVTSFLWASPGSKPEFFSVADFCYFLGLCLGDGHIGEGKITFPKCVANDEAWKTILDPLGHHIGESESINVSGQILRKLCIAFGGKEGNKSADIYLHEDIAGSDLHTWHFLAGLFDSDGCFNYRHGLQVSYTTISQPMAKQINILLRTMGYLSGIRRRKNDSKNCSIKFTRQSGLEFVRDVEPYLRIKKRICKSILDSVENTKDNTINFPVVDLVESERKSKGITKQKLSLNVFGNSTSYCNYLRLLPGRTRSSYFPPEVLSKIADFLGSQILKRISEGDAYFARIKVIEKIPYKGFVYDVSTSTENFISNTFYVHNCTYMRTDSPIMDPSALDEVRSYIDSSFGCDYLPGKANFYKGKAGAQEAHECCRPTHFETQSVSGDGSRLYDLIWRRAVSSQMTPGRDRRMRVNVDIGGYDFIARGSVRLFDGFRRVWHYGRSDDVVLPDLKEGEKCKLKNLKLEQKFTQPPPRFSDASLGKTSEDLMVTRPSTWANSIKTLKNRGYITVAKKAFHPTETGMRVIEFLREAGMCFVDLQFTCDMENLLDDVHQGDKTRSEVLAGFWKRLKDDIENGKKIKEDRQVTEFKCPKCNGRLLSKHSRFGPFFACENSKKGDDGSCKYTARVGDDGKPEEKEPKKKEYADFPCTKCGSKMVKRSSKYGEFYGCEKFPQCRATADTEGNFKETPKKSFKKKRKKKSSS